MSKSGRSFGLFVFGFLGGGLAVVGAALWLELISFEPQELEFEPTYFQVSLAEPHCESGRLDALVADRVRLGGFRSDGLAEHARICGNHRFRPGSADYALHQVAERFRHCFELKLARGVWELVLKAQSPRVCRSAGQSTPEQPVYLCLQQEAATNWVEESDLGQPRDCPAAVERHFEGKLAPAKLR